MNNKYKNLTIKEIVEITRIFRPVLTCENYMKNGRFILKDSVKK